VSETKLLRASQAAAELAISVYTLRRLVRAGVLPAIRYTPRGQLRFDLRDVRELGRSQKVAA